MLGRHWPVVLSILLLGARGGAADGVEATWKSRVELATRRLAAPVFLDTCDKAVEQAFQKSKPNVGEGGTLYPLEIEVDGRKALVSYNYKGGQLDSFAVLSLPSSWILFQKPNSKTVRFVIGDAKCAFDLCPNGPTAEGKCTEKAP
jgi:hypothetical protein